MMLWIVINDANSVQLKSLNHRKSCDLYGLHALKGQKLLAQGTALGFHVRKLVALYGQKL